MGIKSRSHEFDIKNKAWRSGSKNFIIDMKAVW